MFRHILIATDGSKFSAKAVKGGVSLAKKLGAKVTALHAIPKFHASTYRAQMLLSYHTVLLEDTLAGYNAATRICARKILQAVTRVADAEGVECGILEIDSDQPFKAIVEGAKRKGCDLIVMASHGRSGISAVLLGSETQKVLMHSVVPVLVYR